MHGVGYCTLVASQLQFQGNLSMRHRLAVSAKSFQSLSDEAKVLADQLHKEQWATLSSHVAKKGQRKPSNAAAAGSSTVHTAKRQRISPQPANDATQGTDAAVVPQASAAKPQQPFSDPSAIPLPDEEDVDMDDGRPEELPSTAPTADVGSSAANPVKGSQETSEPRAPVTAAGDKEEAEEKDEEEEEEEEEEERRAEATADEGLPPPPDATKSQPFGLQLFLEKPNCPATDKRYWRLHPHIPLSVALRNTSFVEFPKIYVVREEDGAAFKEGEPELPEALRQLQATRTPLSSAPSPVENAEEPSYTMKRAELIQSLEARQGGAGQAMPHQPQGHRAHHHVPPGSYGGYNTMQTPSAMGTVPYFTPPFSGQWPQAMPGWGGAGAGPAPQFMYPSPVQMVPMPYPVFMGEGQRPSYPHQPSGSMPTPGMMGSHSYSQFPNNGQWNQ